MIEHLRELFLNQEDITDLVGRRVFCTFEPQTVNAYPRILFTLTSSDPLAALDGTYGLKFANIDVDCKALDPQDAADVAAVVGQFFNDYTGMTDTGGPIVKAVVLEDNQDYYEQSPHADDEQVYVRLLAYQVQADDS